MSRKQRLSELLDDLIAQAQMDGEEGLEDYSPATNNVRNKIIEQYGQESSDE